MCPSLPKKLASSCWFQEKHFTVFDQDLPSSSQNIPFHNSYAREKLKLTLIHWLPLSESKKPACDSSLRFHPWHTFTVTPFTSAWSRGRTWPRIFDDTAAGACWFSNPEFRLRYTGDAQQHKPNKIPRPRHSAPQRSYKPDKITVR